MNTERCLSLNIKGRLMDLSVPKVMGILNITPDSFYSSSRTIQEEEIRQRVESMLREGVDIIDIGGCSTRPGYKKPEEEEELKRVNIGCSIVRNLAPEIPLSLDTFRATVAGIGIRDWGVDIINDVSGGVDPNMWNLVAKEQVAYVLTHNLDNKPDYEDVTAEVITWTAKQLNELRRLGVKDVIVDPGFGFAKSCEENFKLFAELEEFVKIGAPVLVGISRKSMIYKTLAIAPEDSLTGTIALDAIALVKGCHILRVHDIREAKETVKLIEKLKSV